MISVDREKLIKEQIQQKVAEFSENKDQVESLKIELESILEIYDISIEELWEMFNSAKTEVIQQAQPSWMNIIKSNKEISSEELRYKILERIQQKAENLQESKHGVEVVQAELEAIIEAYELSDEELSKIISTKTTKPFKPNFDKVVNHLPFANNLSKTVNIQNNPVFLLASGFFILFFAPLILALLFFTIITNKDD